MSDRYFTAYATYTGKDKYEELVTGNKYLVYIDTEDTNEEYLVVLNIDDYGYVSKSRISSSVLSIEEKDMHVCSALEYTFIEEYSHRIQDTVFFIPMSFITGVNFGDGVIVGISDANKRNYIRCVVSEHRYRVSDGYKIGIISEDYEKYPASDNFYQCDFVSLVKTGYIKIANRDTHVEVRRCAQHLYGKAMVVFEFEEVVG